MKARPLALATAALFLGSIVGLVTVDEDNGGAAVAAAAAATTRTGSARMETTTVFTAAGGPATTTKITGVVDFGSRRSQLTTTAEGTGPIEAVGDGTVAYLKTTGTPLAAAGRGKPWISFDVSALGEQFAGLAANVDDPTGSLQALADSGFVRNLREEGTDEVRGVRTTRWSGEVDSEKFEDLLSGMTGSLGAPLPAVRDLESRVTVWISDDGLVRRSESQVSGAFDALSFTVTSTTELFGFGEPVRIDLPPPDQVRRITSFRELTSD